MNLGNSADKTMPCNNHDIIKFFLLHVQCMTLLYIYNNVMHLFNLHNVIMILQYNIGKVYRYTVEPPITDPPR